MARSLGALGGRGGAGVVECGRKQPGRTVGGAAAGRDAVGFGWLVGSLAALPLQDVDVLHATTGARLHLQAPFTPLLRTDVWTGK